MWKKYWATREENWVLVQSETLTGYATLGKSLIFLESQFSC